MSSQDRERSARLPWWRRWFGTRSERAAARYMQKLGFRVLFRNWRTKLGELDLIVLDRGCLVFVEVRSTEDEDLQGPLSSVDRAKQQQLTQLALEFLQAKRLLGRKCRFDVLAISWPTGRSEPSMEYVPNAFEATGAFQMHS